MQTSRKFVLNSTSLLAWVVALAGVFVSMNLGAQPNNNPVQNVPIEQVVGGREIAGTLTITDLAVPPGD